MKSLILHERNSRLCWIKRVMTYLTRQSDVRRMDIPKMRKQLFISTNQRNIMYKELSRKVKALFRERENLQMEIHIQKADVTDVDKIDHLMQYVYSNMEDKELFVPDDKAFLMKHINEKGFILIAEPVQETGDTKEELPIAGFLVIRFPENDTDNLGKHLSLPTTLYDKVAHMESAVVHPAYRGCHLQRKLMETAEKELIIKGYKYMMCTVSPDNKYSLQNVKNQGYTVVETVEKYGGKIRSILCKRI